MDAITPLGGGTPAPLAATSEGAVRTHYLPLEDQLLVAVHRPTPITRARSSVWRDQLVPNVRFGEWWKEVGAEVQWNKPKQLVDFGGRYVRCVALWCDVL